MEQQEDRQPVKNMKICHLLYTPFTGLGNYLGFRGNRWLRNRIKVFKQFVIPSLQNQKSKNFILWCSWRREEKTNQLVKDLAKWLDKIPEFRTFHTFHGVCFWDDKYSDKEARDRLLTSLHGSMGELVDVIGDVDCVLMTIQPSDDCYEETVVLNIQLALNQYTEWQAFGYKHGCIMNYKTLELAEYNPNTNPPFFTIKFTKETFIDPFKHAKYTGPYKSHEYVGNFLKYCVSEQRGFLVGTHNDNISTVFNHPFKGRVIEGTEKAEILRKFGLAKVGQLKIKFSLRKIIIRKLPHKIQRKLRYIFGERFWNKIYEFLRT